MPRSVSPLEGVPISVGILAYNEERLIARCLHSILRQRTAVIAVSEVVVICSGCTDSTEAIVQGIAAKDARVRVLVQPQRLGKVVAETAFFALALHEICVVTGGDIVAGSGTLELLCRPLAQDPSVGMTGVRATPARTPSGFAGRLHRTLWALHDEVARSNPKLGEMIAVRRSVAAQVTAEAGCDEVLLERLSLESGLALRYVPEAVVTNFSPTSVLQYLEQRCRVYRQHVTVRKKTGYSAATMDYRTIVTSAVRYLRKHPRQSWLVILCGLLEVGARTWARVHSGPAIIWRPTSTSRVSVAEKNAVEDDLAESRTSG